MYTAEIESEILSNGRKMTASRCQEIVQCSPQIIEFTHLFTGEYVFRTNDYPIPFEIRFWIVGE